jgi:hypothetical protein
MAELVVQPAVRVLNRAFRFVPRPADIGHGYPVLEFDGADGPHLSLTTFRPGGNAAFFSELDPAQRRGVRALSAAGGARTTNPEGHHQTIALTSVPTAEAA